MNKKDYNKKYHREHKKKHNVRSREYYRKNKESEKAKRRKYRKDNPDKMKEFDLRKHYGISLNDYNKLFSKQKGCCAICEKHQSALKRSLCVDHNHITGRVRGLLCDKCNVGVGMLCVDENKTKLLRNAVKYINKCD